MPDKEKQLLDKEKQYDALYFPLDMVEEKKKAYWALLDIDCNFSKLLRLLLTSIKLIADKIKKAEKNYRHYDWEIVIKEKKVSDGKEKSKHTTK